MTTLAEQINKFLNTETTGDFIEHGVSVGLYRLSLFQTCQIAV